MLAVWPSAYPSDTVLDVSLTPVRLVLHLTLGSGAGLTGNLTISALVLAI